MSRHHSLQAVLPLEEPATLDEAAEARRQAFRCAMRGIAATVTVVSSREAGGRAGITATAVTSVSMDPPSLLVCVNRENELYRAIRHSGAYCVNVLRADQQELSRRFSGPIQGEARFAHGEWAEDGGVPVLLDAQASLLCDVVASLDHGTHTVFIGEVRTVRLGTAVAPLLYVDGRYATCETRQRTE